MKPNSKTSSFATRLFVSVIFGSAVGGLLLTCGLTKYAFLGAWNVLALIYGLWTLASVWPANHKQTRHLASRENPGHVAADIFITVASLASLVAVIMLLVQKETGLSEFINIFLSLISVVISWASIHMLYMLKYARLYYGDPEGGVDFNGNDEPAYSDFAYLAFTLGMTYQVSDTALKTAEFRKTVLKHTLLSYLFGTVIIAATINTIVNLP